MLIVHPLVIKKQSQIIISTPDMFYLNIEDPSGTVNLILTYFDRLLLHAFDLWLIFWKLESLDFDLYIVI
jgi:hypothetical protein